MKESIDRDVIIAWIRRFYHRAEVMREIQSDKAEHCRRRDLFHTLAVVVFGALITFMGFMGTDRLAETAIDVIHAPAIVSSTPSANQGTFVASSKDVEKVSVQYKKNFDLAFNGVVLLLFITSLLGLIFRWKEDHQTLFQGVKRLTQYMHWLSEVELRVDEKVQPWLAKEVRQKYQIIVEQLPPNNEREFLRARERLLNKDAKSAGCFATLRQRVCRAFKA